MTKRPDGTLEHDIMSVLWAADGPLQPGEIKQRLQLELAYTSVATVLSRLQAKGWVTRTPVGRAFAYTAAVGEADLAAQRIAEVLAGAKDRDAVLLRFAGKLSRRERKALRALIDEGSP